MIKTLLYNYYNDYFIILFQLFYENSTFTYLLNPIILTIKIFNFKKKINGKNFINFLKFLFSLTLKLLFNSFFIRIKRIIESIIAFLFNNIISSFIEGKINCQKKQKYIKKKSKH